jgi:hypothetical protein
VRNDCPAKVIVTGNTAGPFARKFSERFSKVIVFVPPSTVARKTPPA